MTKSTIEVADSFSISVFQEPIKIFVVSGFIGYCPFGGNEYKIEKEKLIFLIRYNGFESGITKGYLESSDFTTKENIIQPSSDRSMRECEICDIMTHYTSNAPKKRRILQKSRKKYSPAININVLIEVEHSQKSFQICKECSQRLSNQIMEKARQTLIAHNI